MAHIKEIQPLSYTKRRRTFGLLLFIFLLSLPFLYLYATGYRFDLDTPTDLIGTGGIYVAVERTGAEIYIDDELVRETRAFRRAFYAQNLDARTHRVHVQKEGHHTWVKELPVTPHRVTEAQAFNLPLDPQVRVISEWQSATGSAIIRTSLLSTSTVNITLSTTTKATSTFSMNPEYVALITHFSTTTSVGEETIIEKFQQAIEATTTTDMVIATTTKVSNGVRLSMVGDALYASWVGSFEQMPYYYCAEPFPRYSTTSEEVFDEHNQSASVLSTQNKEDETLPLDRTETDLYMHPVQTIPEDAVCDPRIHMDTKGKTIRNFDFFPGSTDFVVMELDDGIYVGEIDNRSWQNLQPLIMGAMLRVYVENGSIYVYDGALIYQVLFEL